MMNGQYPFAGYGFDNAAGICSFVFGLLFLALFDFAIFRLVKKIWVWIVAGVLEILIVISAGFGMWFLTLIACLILLIFAMLLFIVSQNEVRSFFENANWKKNVKDLFRKGKKVKPEYIFDREKVYREIYRAVVDMSQEKRGALITVMKKDDILDPSKVGTVVKQHGVDLDAPVKAELLETIFYVGTRLHDGAVVIKGDKIARAAVFFQSTRQALTGKYGSRHQAALGISENSDSVTIIVSEETGRIGIAFQGELIPVNPDNFMRIFTEYMAYEPTVSNSEDGK